MKPHLIKFTFLCLLLCMVPLWSAQANTKRKSSTGGSSFFTQQNTKLSSRGPTVGSFQTSHHIQVQQRQVGKGQVVLSPKGAKTWNLEGFQALEFTIHNTGSKRVIPRVKILSPNHLVKNFNPGVIQSRYIEPGKTQKLLVYFLVSDAWFKKHHSEYTGLRAGPFTAQKWWRCVYPEAIESITIDNLVIQADGPEKMGTSFTVKNIQPIRFHEIFDGPAKVSMPFIDSFGQFNQSDWEGKIKRSTELKRSISKEDRELKSKPSPKDWNSYGGWAMGPQLKATGYFRVEKIDQQWWLVDPSGHLFWSHGVTCVNSKGADTVISGREDYFDDLPNKNDDRGAFFSKKGGQTSFNYTESNLYLKYGKNWAEENRERQHRRLRSWGMNTFGNWSGQYASEVNKTPFTVAVHYPYERLGEKFPDVWSPRTHSVLRKVLEMMKKNGYASSPWNMGFFINNELHWKDPAKVGKILFQSKASQPAKKHFVSQLKNKYSNIDQLNASWKTQYNHWEALLQSTTAVPFNRCKADLEQFYKDMAHAYFKMCRDNLKEFFPNHMYLGCRFHDHINPMAMEISQEYCDVISYNLYIKSVADYVGPVANLTRPLMATEFHFGALDRGMFHCGLNYASDQDDRAKHYYEYVKGAMKNPLFVGTHWFQYGSQAFTGRGSDGENFQIGLVDIADNPYPEIIEAVRQVGYEMYQLRSAQQ